MEPEVGLMSIKTSKQFL